MNPFAGLLFINQRFLTLSTLITQKLTTNLTAK